MNYLRKICFLVEHEGDSAGKRFREAGAGQPDFEEKPHWKKPVLEKPHWKKSVSGEGVLCVCDDGERARALAAEGIPVLAYLHEENRQQDFSGIKYAAEHLEELDETYFERIYRRLKGIPWEILTTDRCVLRETVEEDADAFFEMYANPQLTRYTDRLSVDKEQEKQHIREYIEKIYGFYEFGVWTVLEKTTGRVIGRAGFSFREGYEEPEIGYVIGVPWQRKGIGEEICRAILDYGREELGLEKVSALVDAENQASLRLCEKLGFQAKEHICLEGRNCLRLLYSCL